MTDDMTDDNDMRELLQRLKDHEDEQDDRLALAINRATGALVTVERREVPMLAGGGTRVEAIVTFHASAIAALTEAVERGTRR